MAAAVVVPITAPCQGTLTVEMEEVFMVISFQHHWLGGASQPGSWQEAQALWPGGLTVDKHC